MTPRLRPDTQIGIEYSDNTPFGAPVSAKLQESLCRLFSKIRRTIEERGPIYVIERSEQFLQELRHQEEFVRLLDRSDAGRITPDVLYPDPTRAKPDALSIRCGGERVNFRLDFDRRALPALHDLMAVLCGEATLSHSSWTDFQHVYGAALKALEMRDVVLSHSSTMFSHEARNRSEWKSCDATFIGHSTVVVRSEATQIVVDPWLLPADARDPEEYRPIARSELGKIDAVLITHSHPDHFDTGTLIKFDRRTKIVVPNVTRESLLSIDMALRLKELGFRDIQVMDWWEETWVGDIWVAALPFFGEQPTNQDQLCQEVRNMGNTYLLRTPRFSCACIADSGRDRSGDVRDAAREAYRRWGRIDLLFAGYRGWYLYPIQYVESSARVYLLFVPPQLYTVRQAIMNGVSEAIDTAEIWHARYIVPYADGGAPWYWRLGLGPILSPADAGGPKEWLHFDPLPDTFLEELRIRSAPTPDVFVGSPVHCLLLRAGQSVRMADGEAQIVDSERHRWPWAGSTQMVR